MILTTYSGDVIFLLKPCKINDRRKTKNIECRCGILPQPDIFVFPCLFLRKEEGEMALWMFHFRDFFRRYYQILF